MQAPLSSTASGQEQRRRPSTGLPSSMLAASPAGETTLEHNKALTDVGAVFDGLSGRVADGVGLAHDAGNLLGALRLYCDLLARPGVLREEHLHYARELQLLSLRSGMLIDRLLNPAATRLQGQAATRRPEAVTVRDPAAMIGARVPEVVEQCRGLLSTIAHRAVAVAIAEGTAIRVPASREALERILVNLTKNAAEASAGGGAITLRVSRVEESAAAAGKGGRTRIVLSVEDQGRGMSVAAVKVLQEDGAAGVEALPIEEPERRGRGIGLRVVRELVRESGGELRFKSRSGCGTTVEIAWAVAADPLADAIVEPVVGWAEGRRVTAPAWSESGRTVEQRRVSC